MRGICFWGEGCWKGWWLDRRRGIAGLSELGYNGGDHWPVP